MALANHGRLSVELPAAVDRVVGRRRLPPHVAPVRLSGQETNPATFAIARMNAVIHDLEADIRIGDTMRQPAFKDAAGRLQTFDAVVANPMWNQNFPTDLYENDPYQRFSLGSADRAWLQHMLASLNATGRMAVVLDTGAVSRGSGNQGSKRERDIRKQFVDRDLVEAVILLPENHGTGHYPGGEPHQAPAGRDAAHASQRFAKGCPKNYLTEAIARRAGEGFSAIITRPEAAGNDSRYVSTNKEEVLPLEEAVVLLREAEEERAADPKLRRVLAEELYA